MGGGPYCIGPDFSISRNSAFPRAGGGGTYCIRPDVSISRNSAIPTGGGEGPTLLDRISLFPGILHFQGVGGGGTYCILSSEKKFNLGEKSSCKDQGGGGKVGKGAFFNCRPRVKIVNSPFYCICCCNL